MTFRYKLVAFCRKDLKTHKIEMNQAIAYQLAKVAKKAKLDVRRKSKAEIKSKSNLSVRRQSVKQDVIRSINNLHKIYNSDL